MVGSPPQATQRLSQSAPLFFFLFIFCPQLLGNYQGLGSLCHTHHSITPSDHWLLWGEMLSVCLLLSETRGRHCCVQVFLCPRPTLTTSLVYHREQRDRRAVLSCREDDARPGPLGLSPIPFPFDPSSCPPALAMFLDASDESAMNRKARGGVRGGRRIAKAKGSAE